MAGTKEGALKAKQKIIELYGKEFYKNLGRKGGRISRRGKAKILGAACE